MTAHLDVVAETVRRLRITSAGTASWFGVPCVALPASLRRTLHPTQLTDGLAYLLQQHLYQYVYITGSPTPVRRDTNPAPPDSVRTDFVQRLSDANSGTGGWESGWTNPPGSPRTVVVKHGLRVTARAHGFRRGPGADPEVELRRAKELTAVSPGYYMVLGNHDLDGFRSGDLVRWYWNLVPEGAERLIRLLTSALNGDDIPFRLKALADPNHYGRCDAAVLYVPQDSMAATADVVEATLQCVRGYLKPATPAFTKPLAPGLSLAENPSSGESFGQHRTSILARALVEAHAHQPGPRSEAELVEAVSGAFREHGLSLDAPFVNAGSRATYDYRFTFPTRRSATDRVGPLAPASEVDPADQLSDCLDTAHALGATLVREAIWSDDECTWLAAAPRQDGLDVGAIRHTGVGPDLYAGTAGIAWLLGCLHGSRPEPRLRATALGALRHAARRGTGTDNPPGLYDGALGVALVAARLSATLAEPELLETARRTLITSCRSDPGSADVLSGLSGMILGLLALDNVVDVDEASRVQALTRWSRSLIEAARTTSGTASWSWSGQRTHRDPTGLSHGAAGVALALDSLAARTGDQELSRTAGLARAYERMAFDPLEGNWADYRLAAGQRRWTPRYSVAWCHGAAGIALDRLRGYQLTGDSRLRDEAHAALGAIRVWLERALEVSSPNFSLCHGIAGNLEVLDRGQDELAPDSSYGSAVDRTALVRHGLTRFRNMATTGAEAPGLMTGLAGFAAFFLREAGHVSPNPLTMIVDLVPNGDRAELSQRPDAPAEAPAGPPARRN
jgi:hypothetical protein